MKIKPMKTLLKFCKALGSTKASKKLFKAAGLGKKDGALDALLDSATALPIVGALAESAGIIPEGKSAAIVASLCAAFPALADTEENPSDVVIQLRDDDDMS